MSVCTNSARAVRLLNALLAAAAVTVAHAEPIVTINDEDDVLPDEAFFAANPTAVVNVETGGLIVPGAPADPFDFNGATVNINAGGAAGFLHFHRSFFDNVDLNLNDGGKLDDGTVFAGATGETLVHITGGVARGRLEMLGDSRLTVSGGTVGGGQPAGAPALIADGSSLVTVSGGAVGHNVAMKTTSATVVTSGSIGDFANVEDDAVLTVAGGTVGRLLHLRDDATINLTGGTIGREFTVVGDGVVNMSGGALERDAGILSVSDGVFNIRGGAVAAGFRAFGGKVNIMGGVIGDRFRLGAPGGGFSSGDAEIFATSATIDGVPITESRVITEREGQFLSADLALDGTIGLDLEQFGDDNIGENSLLTLTLVNEPGDANGDGVADAADYTIWRDNLGAVVPWFTRGDFDGSGVVDTADYGLWAASYGSPGSSFAMATASAVPEPGACLLAAIGLLGAATRRR